MRGLRNELSISCISSFSDKEIDAVNAIAEGLGSTESSTNNVYETGRNAWEELAKEFIQSNVGDEATLYQSKGATFLSVEHHADNSDYADTSGGAMAKFSF